MRFVKLAVVLALGLVVASPMLAQAQSAKSEFKGVVVSKSSGVLAENTSIDVYTAPVLGEGYFVVTQACSSLGNDEAVLENATSTIYLELRSGCTTFTPGFVWPSGEIVRLHNMDGSGQTGSIWITGMRVKK